MKIDQTLIEHLDQSLTKLEKMQDEYRAQFQPQRVTREDWQRAIEQSIQTFNGDAVEVSELLDALIGGLKNRYDRDQLRDVDHEYDQLRDSLKELDQTTGYVSKQDLADWQADQEYGNNEEGELSEYK
jgi:hypothetical protein